MCQVGWGGNRHRPLRFQRGERLSVLRAPAWSFLLWDPSVSERWRPGACAKVTISLIGTQHLPTQLLGASVFCLWQGGEGVLSPPHPSCPCLFVQLLLTFGKLLSFHC